MSDVAACSVCLRRTWLVARLGAHVERARHARPGALRLLLALDDEQLMRAAGAKGDVVGEYEAFRVEAARTELARAELSAVCRHDERYPAALRDLPDPPAVIHVAGALARLGAMTAAEQPAVAVVGARKASDYGLEVARALGRGLAAAAMSWME